MPKTPFAAAWTPAIFRPDAFLPKGTTLMYASKISSLEKTSQAVKRATLLLLFAQMTLHLLKFDFYKLLC